MPPPDKREQVLEKLPLKQQANLRERLDRFDKLPAAERDIDVGWRAALAAIEGLEGREAKP